MRRPRFAIVRTSWIGEWENMGFFSTKEEAVRQLRILNMKPREDCRIFILVSKEVKQTLINDNFYKFIPAEVKKFLKW